MDKNAMQVARRAGSRAAAAVMVLSALGLAEVAAAQPSAGDPTNPGEGEPDDLFKRARAIDEEYKDSGAIEAKRTLTLDEVAALVVENNRDVKLAQERLVQSQVLQDRAWALLLPTAQVQFIYTRYDEEISSQFPSAPGAPPIEFVIRPLNDYRFSGTLSLSLFNGRAFPLLEVAYLSEELQRLGNAQLVLELRYAVAQQYLQLLTFKRLIVIAEESVKARQLVLDATKARLASGTATPFEVTRAESALLTSQNDLEANKLAFNRGREGLAALVLTEPDFDVQPIHQRALPASRDAFIEQALTERADLKLARQQVQSLELQRNAHYWRYAPTLLGQLNVSRTPETAFSPEPWQWNLQLIASWTLYDGGMREADLTESASQLRAASLEIEKLEGDIRRDIRLAWLEIENVKIQLASLREQVALAEKALGQAQDGYQLGAITQIDVLDAETNLRLARANLARAELSYDVALENMWRVAGVDVTKER